MTYADGAVSCCRCHAEGSVRTDIDGKQRGRCWADGCYNDLVPPPIVWRVRRGKRVQVPARWVGVLTTDKTKRERRSEAKAKRRTVRGPDGVMSKAAFRKAVAE